MIRRLKTRFIVTSMLAVGIVILIMIVAINLVNYVQIIDSADDTLSLLAENGGVFPKFGPGGESPPGLSNRDFSPEEPFQNRYFTVAVNSDGLVTAVNTGSIAAVETLGAKELALEVLNNGKAKGFSGAYRYKVARGESGSMVLFLDRSRELESFSRFFYTSLLAALAAMGGIFVFLFLFSRRAVRPIAESYTKQKRFITDAGHELKTPLAVISANAEVLELIQGENEWTRSIKNQVERLSRLTNGLISLSRMDEAAAPDMSEFELSEALEEWAEPFKAVAAAAGKELTTDIEKGLRVYAVEESVRMLVGILLDNALKYSDRRGPVSLTLRRQGKGVCLRVRNTVEAIEPGIHEEFFTRFYRADQSRGETSGYGLGLSIARAICRSNRGTVTAESPDGVSVVLTVRF